MDTPVNHTRRDISVPLDPVDAIYVVAALAEMESRWSGAEWIQSLTTRAQRIRRVREAIEVAVYGPAGAPTESEMRLMDGNR